MKKAIIHLSDLHISLHEDLKGNPPKKGLNSWLTTKPNDSISLEFVNAFINYIKVKFSTDYEFTLLVTGDISNEADEKEFEYASKYLEKITTELNIKKSNIILLPGDHDINRTDNKDAFKSGKSKGDLRNSYEYYEKYDKFSSFYLKFLGSNFDKESAIINLHEYEDEKLLLMGINSNYLIDYEGGNGFIETEKLRKELNELNSKYSEYSKIVAFHHNIYSAYENKGTGQWDLNNRKDILAILNQFSVKCILYGNEHTRDSKFFGSKKEDLMYRCDSGCFASKGAIQPSFKVYELQHNKEQFKIKNSLILLQNANKLDEQDFGKWGIQDNYDLNELEEIVLIESPSKALLEINLLDKLIEETVIESSPVYLEETNMYTNSYYKEKLFNIVKNKKIFHSGHFHWSETSRAHNWIDISKILNDKDDLYDAKNAIIDVIEICKLNNKFDFIIGLGIEGNILSTRASVKYDKPYSFLPYSYRYDEHNKYEKVLNFKNDNKFKSVLIITDVVNDGRTLRKLINKREPEFFKEVNKIIVVSLFYTGNDNSNSTQILNTVEGNYDDLNDHLEHRIEYYYVLNMKVEKCPYGANYESECIIVKDGLGCVHNFYDKVKADEKKSK